jgi:hypothetical protein
VVVLRPDVEKALDDLISNEGGMKFQGLAVVLAKQRWPDLIACERKKDLGADAIGSGRGFACSLTATLGKIKKDATKIKKHFDIKTLVFATPEGVTNTTAENWAAEIRKEFGYDLVEMPREDVITSLLNPANLALCRTHLGIPVTLEQPVEELLQKVRDAASDAQAAWSVRLAGKPLIELRAVTINPDGKDATDVFLLADFQCAMMQSRRAVIEAPAGRGKTTTLVQLAAEHASSGGLAFLVDLPAWVKSGTGILQYIAGMPAFQSRSINAEGLARLQRVEHFSFLLNAWNEVAESDSLRAVQTLKELERDFPGVGILVATRTHHIVPPLPGALRTRLLPVNRAQRKRYLDQRLGDRADELRAKLERDPVLDELTETPLILSEVATIFEAGARIPQTKIGVLESVMRLLEQSPEHSGHLQVEPLSGRAQEYLCALAAAMTEQGAVTLPEDNARAIAHSVAVKLRAAGQIATPPEPQAVLNVLCAHHALERLTYPVTSFRFAHQQFQEFYAALLLKRQLLALVGSWDSQNICDYTKRYMNEPAWSEPLRMIANETGVMATASPGDGTAIRSGRLLIEMAVKADPVFAAELAYLCGASVWKEIGSALAQRLRAMYGVPDEHFRQRALAGMLASGSQDFKDVVLPLLTNANDQVRLGAYRTWPDFHVSSIGPDWQETVRGWSEGGRADFVSELLHFGNARETIASFALADPSVKVRTTAISALVWRSSREETVKLLGLLDEDTFKAALHELPLEAMHGPMRTRALAAYRESYSEATDPVERLRKLLLIAEAGNEKVVAELKDELNKCPRGTLEQLGRYVTKPALDLIRQTEPEWVSHWVAERIVDRSLYPDHWIALVSNVPDDLKERLLQSVESEDLQNTRYSGSFSLLRAVSDANMAGRIFERLCALWRIITGAPDVRHDLEWALERQLEDLFRTLPPDVAVKGLANRLSSDVEPLELTVVTRLFGTVGRNESDLRSTLRSELRQMLRTYLTKGVPVMLREDDFNGEQKANLASALAQVGEPEDLPVLRELIRADIVRRQRGMEAKMRGDRSKLANGAPMSYANWHVRALLQLARDTADNLLLETMKEPEYERDSAWGLVQIASSSKVEAGFGFGLGFVKHTDYAKIWEARRGQLPVGFNEDRRKRFAAAIRERIESILQESKDAGQPRAYDFRLKELTKALAVIDSAGSADLILKDLLSSQDTWNGWPVVQALDTLLFNGIVLPTDETLKIFDTLLGHVRAHLWDSQQVGLLIHALCLLPFIEDAAAGIAKIREVVAELKLRTYQLRDVTAALGNSRCPDALALLREFASDDILVKQLGETWINAVAALDYPESRRLLLSFVDPESSGLPAGLTFEREDVLAARLAELARRDTSIAQRLFQLCTVQLPSPKRMLLAKVVGMLGTTEAIVVGLDLLDDTAEPPVPYDIWKQLEATFVEHKVVSPESSAYTPAPRSANSIRSRLFEMVAKDNRRSRAAYSLLGQIEVWRLEYGRPNGEPRNPDVECRFSWLVPVRAAEKLSQKV